MKLLRYLRSPGRTLKVRYRDRRCFRCCRCRRCRRCRRCCCCRNKKKQLFVLPSVSRRRSCPCCSTGLGCVCFIRFIQILSKLLFVLSNACLAACLPGGGPLAARPFRSLFVFLLNSSGIFCVTSDHVTSCDIYSRSRTTDIMTKPGAMETQSEFGRHSKERSPRTCESQSSLAIPRLSITLNR